MFCSLLFWAPIFHQRPARVGPPAGGSEDRDGEEGRLLLLSDGVAGALALAEHAMRGPVPIAAEVPPSLEQSRIPADLHQFEEAPMAFADAEGNATGCAPSEHVLRTAGGMWRRTVFPAPAGVASTRTDVLRLKVCGCLVSNALCRYRLR
jgi:hypothetical protein